jgi:hypothetical protein
VVSAYLTNSNPTINVKKVVYRGQYRDEKLKKKKTYIGKAT